MKDLAHVSPSGILSSENLRERLKCESINEAELELLIQKKRVMNIMEEAIDRLKMAVCLPRLLRRNGCLLHKFMQSKDVKFIQNICYEVLDMPLKDVGPIAPKLEIERISKASSRSAKRRMEATSRIDSMVNYNIAKVLEMLWMNKALKQKVLQEFPKIKPNSTTRFIEELNELRETIRLKLDVTARAERDRDKQLRSVWEHNEKTEKKIEELKAVLEKQRTTLGSQIESKKSVIADLQKKMEEIKAKFKVEVFQRSYESEKKMELESEMSEEKQKELEEEATAITQQYETLLQQHIAFEKKLREKRLKIETQLVSWLNKYDADMTDRQREMDRLIEGYDKEKEEMEALQKLFDKQEVEYQKLWQAKVAEEEAWLEEAITQFNLNRAARKIQRAWREYWQRKMEKKKAKKGGKGKKMELPEKPVRKEIVIDENDLDF